MNLNTCNDEDWGQFVILDLEVVEPKVKVYIKMPSASLMTRRPCRELSILRPIVDDPYMTELPLVSRCILHVVTGVTDVYNFIAKM